MSNIKPGQFANFNGILYRAKKRVDGCKGCDLDSITLCPCIVDHRHEEPKYNCALLDIIFKKV